MNKYSLYFSIPSHVNDFYPAYAAQVTTWAGLGQIVGKYEKYLALTDSMAKDIYTSSPMRCEQKI